MSRLRSSWSGFWGLTTYLYGTGLRLLTKRAAGFYFHYLSTKKDSSADFLLSTHHSFNIISYFPLDFIKFFVRYLLETFQTESKPKENIEYLARTSTIGESYYGAPTGFFKTAKRRLGLGRKKIAVSDAELRRFSSAQAQEASRRLSRAM
ncbi:hypothetical protein CF319_g9533 [Tilletia indica]|nr:hypothetical protein CF319_g9533 [Tilletia indica]